ncbi:MAG: hypothetical protein LBP87_08295, partial [Planctomycetaceae bacterium]|nr:hypothetical protein [Planctomycetaceae bacterium]
PPHEMRRNLLAERPPPEIGQAPPEIGQGILRQGIRQKRRQKEPAKILSKQPQKQIIRAIAGTVCLKRNQGNNIGCRKFLRLPVLGVVGNVRN